MSESRRELKKRHVKCAKTMKVKPEDVDRCGVHLRDYSTESMSEYLLHN